MPRRRRQSGFTLVELLVAVAIVGILASIALPSLQRVRMGAIETGVVGNLHAMAKTQEMFWLNPIPLRPSSLTQTDRRYARLHELNGFARNAFGTTTSRFYIVSGQVRYSMVPRWPSTNSLLTRYTIEARGTGAFTFIYSMDQSGQVVKIR